MYNTPFDPLTNHFTLNILLYPNVFVQNFIAQATPSWPQIKESKTFHLFQVGALGCCQQDLGEKHQVRHGCLGDSRRR